MKTSLLGTAAALLGCAAAQDPRNVDVYNTWVYKQQDPSGNVPTVIRYVYMNIWPAGGSWGITCEASAPPTFPTGVYTCWDPRYSFIFREAEEGSGLDFGVDIFYDDPETGETFTGSTDLEFDCRPRRPEGQNLYNCDLSKRAPVSLD